MKLKKTFMITMLSCAMVPVIVASLIYMYSYFTQSIGAAEENLRNASKIQAQHIEDFFLQRETNLDLLAQTPQMQALLTDAPQSDDYALNQEQANMLLRIRVERRGFLSTAYLVDKNGTIVASSNTDQCGQQYPRMGAVPMPQAGKVFYIECPPVEGDTTRLTILKSVYYKGQYMGFICEDINASYFEALALQTKVFKSGYLIIVDKQGDPVAVGSRDMASWTPQQMQQAAANATAVAGDTQLDARTSGLFRYKMLGVSKLAYFYEIPNLEWVVVSVVEENEFLTPSITVAGITMLLALCAALMAYLVYLYIVNTISKPLADIMDTMDKIQQGDYSGRIEYAAENELKILTSAFNTLMDKIADDNEILLMEAQYDGLTGLYNKNTTQKLIASHLEHSPPETQHALLVIDIDLFKDVNDTYGHAKGDEVLATFAAMLKELFRTSDILGRVGGDEFVAFVKDVYGDQFVTERLEEAYRLLKTTLSPQLGCTVGCSIGVYIGTEKRYSQIFDYADRALYVAKEKGRGCFVIHKL